MWTDIATGSVVIIFIGLIFKFHQAKLGKLEETKLSKEVFKENQKTVKEDLKRGEEKFNKISKILTDQAVMLGRIDERVLSLARKNGIEL